jgi:hypothetical protein
MRVMNRQAGKSHRERDGDYCGVMFPLNTTHRLVVCQDGIQWVVQRRDGPGRWKSLSYCRTQQGLLLAVKRWAIECQPEVRLLLEALPQTVCMTSAVLT